MKVHIPLEVLFAQPCDGVRRRPVSLADKPVAGQYAMFGPFLAADEVIDQSSHRCSLCLTFYHLSTTHAPFVAAQCSTSKKPSELKTTSLRIKRGGFKSNRLRAKSCTCEIVRRRC